LGTAETVHLDPGDIVFVAASTGDPTKDAHVLIQNADGVVVASSITGPYIALNYEADYQWSFGKPLPSDAFSVIIENPRTQSVRIEVDFSIDVGYCESAPMPTATSIPSPVESVPLIPGCNPVASTYPDNTPIGDIVNAVSSPSVSIWKFGQDAWWYGYSSDYPGIGDLTELDRLDVVFICVGHSATFTRPLI
jgi:hypothetical protein